MADKYNFLNDRPTIRDEIGTHSKIAESLLKIIHSNLKRPFVVGLFGPWGVGKSSIVEMLQEKVRESKEPVKVVLIDAWRTHRETFLREFVKKLARELLSENQAEEVAKETDIKRVDDESSWKPGPKATKCFYGFVIVLLALSSILLINYFLGVKSEFPGDKIAIIILTGLIAIYFQYILPKYSVTTNSRVEDVTLHDVTHFRKIYFEKIIDKCKPKTVCIVVDNLDRVDAEDAVAIMRAIKTFIVDVEEEGPTEESKDAVPHKLLNKVVFIIPCDDGALRQHVVKRNSEESGNKFLRKFFNISLRIPNFNDRDCYRYACNLLNETNLELDEIQRDRIADIIKSLFGNNPRQPKIFINNFLARYILAENFEKDGKIPEDMATAHPQWFAVYIALDTEFADLEMPKTADSLRALLMGDDKGKNENEKLRRESRVAFLQKVRFIVERITPQAWAAYSYLKQPNDLLLIDGFPELQEEAFKGSDDFVERLEGVIAKQTNAVQLLWNVSSSRETRMKILHSLLKAKVKKPHITLKGRVLEEMANLIEIRIDDLPMLPADVVYKEIVRPQEQILCSILNRIVAVDSSGAKPELFNDGGPKQFQVELVKEVLIDDSNLSVESRACLSKAVDFLGGRSDKLTIPAIKNGKYRSANIMEKGITLFREGSGDLCPSDLVTFCGSFEGDKCINHLKQVVDVLNQNLTGDKYKTKELCEATTEVNALIKRENTKGVNVAQVNVVNTIQGLDRRYEQDKDWDARYEILKTVKDYCELTEFKQWQDTAITVLINRGGNFLKSGEESVVSKFLKKEKHLVKVYFEGLLPATAGRYQTLCHDVLDYYPDSSQAVITSVFLGNPGWILSWVESRGPSLEEEASGNVQSSLLVVAAQTNYSIEIYKALSFLDVSKLKDAKQSRDNHFSSLIQGKEPLTVEKNLAFVLERIVSAAHKVNRDQADILENAFKEIKQDIVSHETLDMISKYKKLQKKK